jgi:hypothetical protein
MIDIKVRYQTVAFMPSIEANSVNISKMMELFTDRGLVPTTQPEPSIANPLSQTQVRFNLKSANNEWDIHFGIDRIDITKNATDVKGDNLGTIEQFCADVSDIFLKINSKYPQQANRIALLSNVILNEMKEDVLAGIYLKLFNPIKLYAKNMPTEWNSRTIARLQKEFSGNTEIFNFVSDVNRINGLININQEIKPIDRIAINIDINTIPTTTIYRFGTKELEGFYNNVSIWHNELLSNIFDKIK